jgi:cytochrome o ubiquinol oxidase subunit 3
MAIELPGAYSFSAPKPDHAAHHHDHKTDDDTIFGFWIYVMTDCVLFATLFAAFAVLRNNFADGPTGKEIFELPYVLVETFLLLFSSVTYGMGMLGLTGGAPKKVLGWLAITFLFGLGFIGMEINEFHHLVSEGNGPDRSAFLSSFFTLVATHGLHVTCGLLWMAVMMFQIMRKGLNSTIARRLTCLSLFWHFLDIVWICVFTFVYLMGVI